MTEFRHAGNGDFALGSRVWPGLSKLIEEMGEVQDVLPELLILKFIGRAQQVAGKLIMTHGRPEHWDGAGPLNERLGEELADLGAAIRAFMILNGYAGNQALVDREIAKTEQFLKWHTDALPDTEDTATPPQAPWQPGAQNNCRRAGWQAFFDDKPRDSNPFPPVRTDLKLGFEEGWDAAKAINEEN